MKLITSRENAQFKQLKLLSGNVPPRKRGGMALAEGIHLCQAYLSVGLPQQVVVSSEALAHPEVQQVLAASAEVPVLQLPGALFAELSQLEHGIGLLFVIKVPQYASPPSLDQDAVLLDQVQDPGNMGSILRSAAAAGIKRVYAGSGCVQCWSPKVLRAGMGAHFVLDIYEGVALLPLLQLSKVAVLATSSHSQQLVYDVNLRPASAWLFGNEGQGVAADLMAAASHLLALPHAGAIESLNVAACAAVCFFEQLRQRQLP